jgi:cell fate (sporulation/competence/biofilm development) regulator YmcA (YheA/YmcA/DUF963 family)
MTARTIVKDLINFRISEDEAVRRIEELVANAVDEVTGFMGATEQKILIDLCKDYYRNYGYPIKGNMDDIKDIVRQAVEMCGYSKLEEIKNTKQNLNRIKDTISDNSVRFFG